MLVCLTSLLVFSFMCDCHLYIFYMFLHVDPGHFGFVSEKGWKYIGDNLDLTVKVRDMRQDNPNESYHFFHTIAVQDRIDANHLDSPKPQQLVSNLSVSDFLLSSSEYNCLREDFIVLVARVIVNEFKQFRFLAGGVPSHISHRYSQQMASKSTVVRSIGVLLRHPSIKI